MHLWGELPAVHRQKATHEPGQGILQPTAEPLWHRMSIRLIENGNEDMMAALQSNELWPNDTVYRT